METPGRSSEAPGACSPAICEAVDTIRRFVTEVAGYTPSDEEIAAALKRYFVLNEIKEHILME